MINYVTTVEPAFSSPAKMLTLSDLGAGKPLMLVYDRCPNKLVNYLETNLVRVLTVLVTCLHLSKSLSFLR